MAGESLSAAEAEFFTAVQPLGFILFARNCREPEQVKALVQSLQAALGRTAPILIDQEGGRVQRLKPPHWKQYPPAQDCGAAALQGDTRLLRETTAGIAGDLSALGINVNCAPVLDIRFPQTHVAIGNRAYADKAATVGELGALVCREYLAGGVIPVIKHLPGLGRADLDTHHDLPAVMAPISELETTDFAPFRAVSGLDCADGLWGMVSHALYSGIDADTPASCSKAVIGGAIRRDIGFDGLLLSDDLSMGALNQVGDAASRAVRVLEAGCDIALHCNGELADMKLVAERVPLMTNEAVVRYNRSIAYIRESTV